MFEQKILVEKARKISDVAQFLYQRGWSPATSSNYSCRLDAENMMITVSHWPKEELTKESFMVLNIIGKALSQASNSAKVPSTEIELHAMLYKANEATRAIFHTHSVNTTVLSKWCESDKEIILENYQMLKSFNGINSHEEQEIVPIFHNTQDVSLLVKQVKAYLIKHPNMHGFLIAGHGLYTWGKTIAEAKRHIEAFEFLFECEILTLRLKNQM